MDISSDKQAKSLMKNLDMIRKGNPQEETESHLIWAQNNVIKTY